MAKAERKRLNRERQKEINRNKNKNAVERIGNFLQNILLSTIYLDINIQQYINMKTGKSPNSRFLFTLKNDSF